MRKKTALVFGATGLTGSSLLHLLLADSRYDKVKIFVRRKPDFPVSPKLELHVVDLNSPDQYAHLLCGDDLFCCLGTTISKAGSKAAFRNVDFDLPVKIAEAASKNSVSAFIAISSLGADSKSSNFYLRTKGEMEEVVRKFSFKKFAALRPSLLLGSRKEFRFGEIIGKVLMRALSVAFIGNLKKYRAIQANDVSKAMIVIANSNFTEEIFESERIKMIADSS